LKHGKEYGWLSSALLGNDLYANQPFCEAIIVRKSCISSSPTSPVRIRGCVWRLKTRMF
jgi:hypothetical protein